jgi:hypothetical protein
MNQTLFLSQLRVIILVGIAFAAGKGWLSSSDSSAIVSILTPVGIIAGPWLWSIYSNINSKLVPQHAVVIDPINTTANAGAPTATVHTDAGTITGKVVAVLAIMVLGAPAWPSDAMAQGRKVAVAPPPAASQPAITGNALSDLTTIISKLKPPPTPTTPDEIQSTTCDFTIFAKLTFANVVPLLQKCAQMVDQNVAAPLVHDTELALASAKAYGCGDSPAAGCPGDGIAIACLTPALSLLKAAEGTPAVKDVSGVVTTPAVAAGVVLIGQKLGEFVEAGGPSNCKTAVQRTINGLAAAALSP